jgi:hypothetical protein
MAKRVARAANQRNRKRASHKAATPSKHANGSAKQPAANGTPHTVDLRAQVSGAVTVRLRVLDPAYTAKRVARLLNAGNASWDVGDPARYHRIQVGGRVIAEIEFADEDTRWQRYEPT